MSLADWAEDIAVGVVLLAAFAIVALLIIV
jgi:hypothetical protein